jgi:hypothetical protein
MSDMVITPNLRGKVKPSHGPTTVIVVTEEFFFSNLGNRFIPTRLVERGGCQLVFRISWGPQDDQCVMRNHTDQIRECFRQAAECAQQADARIDPKVKQQFLVLTRLWLILADRFELNSAYQAQGTPREPRRRLGQQAMEPISPLESE